MTDVEGFDDDLDFDVSELKVPTEEEISFANDIYRIFQDVIDNESNEIGENPVSRSNLVNCFNKHCLGKNTDRQSSRQNVFYDFKHINQYKDREDKLKAEIEGMGESSRNIIGSLLDSEKVLKKLKSFFKGDKYLMFCQWCGFRKDGEAVMLVLHSFGSCASKNYRGSTVDVILTLSPKNIVTMYPIDANDLQNCIDKAIKNFKNKAGFEKGDTERSKVSR